MMNTPAMCHQTLKSFSREVRRIPKMLINNCGIINSAITKTWKCQFVSEPKNGTCVSLGKFKMRVNAPIKYVAAATLIPAVAVTCPTIFNHAVAQPQPRPPSRSDQ
jgi:hypothetical protein